MKKKILIKGRIVHDVGYRLLLMNSAEDLRIENFDAKNVKEDGKQVVRVLVESSGDNVNKFLGFVEDKENRPERAKVDSVDVVGYDGYVRPLESFRLGFMAYQQQKFANAGVGLLKEVKEFRKESCGKQGQMLEKQDQTIVSINRLDDDTTQNFNRMNVKYDKVSEKMDAIDDTLKELTKAILKLAKTRG